MRLFRSSGWALAMVVILCRFLWAGGAGTSAAEFLSADASARAEAMGGAYSALSEDASSIKWNPAGLAALDGRSVTLTYASGLESTSQSFAAYAQPIGRFWGAGVGVLHQSAGSLSGRDTSGFPTGDFAPSDTALLVGVARTFGSIRGGATAKFVRSKVVDSASTFTGDLGLLWKGLAGERLSLALTATQVGGKIDYGTLKEPLPSEYRAGAGFRVDDRWTFGFDVAVPNDGDAYFAAGVERSLIRCSVFSMLARGGFQSRSTSDTGSLSGSAFGLGFGFQGGLTIDYAFLPQGDLGQAQRMSLSYRF